MKISALLVLLSADIVVGFTPSSISRESHSVSSSLLHATNKQQSNDKNEDSAITKNDGGRRAAFSSILGAAALLPALASAPSPAMAQEELFKSNPLTNGVLEKIRIWNQESVDDIKYGGELEAGDAGNKGKVEAYPRLLVPIVQIANDLTTVNQLVRDDSADRVTSWTKARTILAKPEYEKLAFKKIFNAYGDNIYYSDPDRANAYLGGGASPKSEQSLAYLLRNDVLTNLENLQAELDYLLKPATPESESPDDLYGYAQTAKTAMDKYLTLAPPTELKKAMEMIASSS
mmetsp:Transcript_12558/g.20924  ORF Transcript_12558/g.20924 Transcript_12558/m.20924 type:complete len:289 (+) Transcript_12558:126-992(+)|eukprot:CAMPEP_0119009918 /NCGR_PEP_ID=MMETSP1176-20130426/4675_1 /TAXON_ID=265551 /ORGANISM="Synedropsis recta cf, Strain CCMP1620" /LENGTH=288 /DNA_ID=CAMNT_0006962499 /DNA_START=73 /DNA_END=942 /DNA_ORIENTATION=+